MLAEKGSGESIAQINAVWPGRRGWPAGGKTFASWDDGRVACCWLDLDKTKKRLD
jgi:hypothetical protein